MWSWQSEQLVCVSDSPVGYITEGDIYLAISNVNIKQDLSARRAAAIFNIPQTTACNQRDRQRPQRERKPNFKRLTELEEDVIVQRVLDLALRGVPPPKAILRGMANKLLQERNGKPVSVRTQAYSHCAKATTKSYE